MLPKLSYPTFETTVPSTQEKVKYRPFLVREHRMLMKAIEFNNDVNLVETFKDLVNECTFNAVDASKLTMFDVDWLFLKIKSASTGGLSPVRYKCVNTVDGVTCGAKITLNLNTDTAVVKIPDASSLVVDLGGGIGVRLRYPTFEEYTLKPEGMSAVEVSEELMLSCIAEAWDKDQTYEPGKDFSRQELKEWLGFISETAGERIADFIINMPQVTMSAPIKCPKCGSESVLDLEGLDDFLE